MPRKVTQQGNEATRLAQADALSLCTPLRALRGASRVRSARSAAPRFGVLSGAIAAAVVAVGHSGVRAEVCTVFTSCNIPGELISCGAPSSCTPSSGTWGTDSCPTWSNTCFAVRPGRTPFLGMGDPPKPPAKTKPECDSAVGNPIDGASAAKFQQELDVDLPGRNMMIQRVYTSAVVERSFRWNHERRVYGDSARVTVTRPTGAVEGFNGAAGVYTPDVGVNGRVTRLTSGGATSGWVYVSEDDEVESYNAGGLLLSITHRTGERLTVAYGTDSFGGTYPFARTLTYRSGRAVTFTYDANNNISTARLPAGGVINYTYNASNHLTRVTYPDKSYRSYLFNEQANTANTSIPWALTGIVD